MKNILIKAFLSWKDNYLSQKRNQAQQSFPAVTTECPKKFFRWNNSSFKRWQILGEKNQVKQFCSQEKEFVWESNWDPRWENNIVCRLHSLPYMKSVPQKFLWQLRAFSNNTKKAKVSASTDYKESKRDFRMGSFCSKFIFSNNHSRPKLRCSDFMNSFFSFSLVHTSVAEIRNNLLRRTKIKNKETLFWIVA